MLSLLWYLCRLSFSSLSISIAASLAAAAANLYLMSIIVAAFKPAGDEPHQILAFGLLCLLLLCARTASQILLIRMTQDTVYNLHVKISRQVAAMEQDSLEQLGSIPVLTVISDDVNIVSALGTQVPALVMNVSIFVGVLSYVLYVSTSAFLMLLIMVIVSTVGYKLLARNTSALMTTYRQKQELVLQSVSSLIAGSKELRLNDIKQEHLLEEINDRADQARRFGFSAWRRHSIAGAWAYTSYFVTVGVLIICSQLLLFGLNQRSALAAVFGILFLKGAIETIFSVIPTIGLAQVAFRRIEDIGITLQSSETKRSGSQVEVASESSQFQRIRLLDVEYSYSGKRGDFHLGPLSLDIHQGEILFIAGGNGAGKTSLLKLLCGLYAPTAGFVEIDGVRITPERSHTYRQMFSAVFQDFQVFKRLDNPTQASLEQAQRYVREFQLEQCAGVDGVGFTAGTVSRGQHKRLALAAALMEDKQVHILDEWAADQDPHFRAYFYDELIPQMRAEGRTVVAVTHDDAWYQVADRVLWLSDGMLRSKDISRPRPLTFGSNRAESAHPRTSTGTEDPASIQID